MKSLVLATIVLSLGCGAFAGDLGNALADSQTEQGQAFMNLQRFLGQSKQVMYAAADTKTSGVVNASDGMTIRLKKIKKKSKV